jgi:hypothetical protein
MALCKIFGSSWTQRHWRHRRKAAVDKSSHIMLRSAIMSQSKRLEINFTLQVSRHRHRADWSGRMEIVPSVKPLLNQPYDHLAWNAADGIHLHVRIGNTRRYHRPGEFLTVNSATNGTRRGIWHRLFCSDQRLCGLLHRNRHPLLRPVRTPPVDTLRDSCPLRLYAYY